MATDLEREIRELLSDRAGDVRPPADAHPKMLHRARRRRIGTAFVSSLVVAGFVAAAVVGTRELLTPSAAPERETRLGGTNEETFAVWPQTTREEAREVQTCVDLGRAECTWQLNALEVVRRYGEQELGWDQVFAFVEGFSNEYLLLPLEGESQDIGLVDVVDPLTVRMAECLPRQSGDCRAAEVLVEKPLVPDVYGIWLITEAGHGTHSVQEPSGGELPRSPDFLIERFMQARFAGSGAEGFLSDHALDTYERGIGGLSLYGYTTDTGTAYDVRGWERQETPDPGQEGYSVIITIENTGSTVASEILELRPPPCPPGVLCDFDYQIVDAERIE